ncbi:MAG: alpha-ketoglutarate-dependent dioxygenase AlkB [bacterium]|nr:alpha-ketoglutarate-dependent dioxygenase AlkB [bacterium]
MAGGLTDYDRAFVQVVEAAWREACESDPEAAAVPEGLVYRAGFLSEERERELVTWIDSEESSVWLGDLSRRVQHYGYKYDYSYRGIDASAHLGPLPPWLERLGRDVVLSAIDLCHPIDTFDQAIVNEYLPGQGIAPHTDRDCFGPVVATVSLNSDVVMDFVGPDGQSYSQTLQRRSLVLLAGSARADWRHGIAKRKNDRDRVSGQVLPRRRRVSITFRTVLLDA